jgi:primosomal protein N'
MHNTIHTPTWVAATALAVTLIIGGVSASAVHSSTEQAKYTTASETRNQVVFEQGFSPVVRSALEANLASGGQTLVFLNRRGYSTSLQCPKCGYVAQCPNCSVSLTYHRTVQQLMCHICGHSVAAPTLFHRHHPPNLQRPRAYPEIPCPLE